MGAELVILFVCSSIVIAAGFVYVIMRSQNHACEIAREELITQLGETRDILSESQERLQDMDLTRTKAETQAERIPALESQLYQSHQELIQVNSKIAELEANLTSERKLSDEKLPLQEA